MGFWNCIKYLAGIGFFSFIVGRILPKKWFQYDKFPYVIYQFENDGRIYERIKIRSWQAKIPDMSRIFPKLMPAKKFNYNDVHRLPEMIQETCIAEFIHVLLCFAGLHCISIWEVGGTILAILNVIGNLPFVLVQRFNRPRLVRLMKNTEKRRILCEY